MKEGGHFFFFTGFDDVLEYLHLTSRNNGKRAAISRVRTNKVGGKKKLWRGI